MVRRDRASRVCWALLFVLSPMALPPASAGESASRIVSTAALANPHTLDLELDFHAKRRARSRNAGGLESPGFLDPTPGLQPLTWPRNSDMRSRLLTPELKRAPLVGWIAENLYRSRRENGWCLEVDPGEGEYLVFYRVHLR
jgi:hypothetical protein